ncbi:GNAT family N-acetyltransferase [Clostridium sp.]|uniref:GNAT family N-acetyltransferase n=1 Tax=Clostridium sp. TaxID=1506 RepID=UPI003D6D62CA
MDIVSEVNVKIVGNIVYTKAIDDNCSYHNVISFGLIFVLPAFQGKGIGGILIENTNTMAKELGYTVILIYGDPDYFSQFGFTAAQTYKIGTSDNMYAVPLQALELYHKSLLEQSLKPFLQLLLLVGMGFM